MQNRTACLKSGSNGLTDMIVVAKFKNRSQLSNFVKRDLTLPYVERTNTHVVLLTVKEDFRLILRQV
jgi:DNA-binding Lrp family transcriptional regulator